MWASLRLSLCIALGLCLSACAESAAPSNFEPIWGYDDEGTPVHLPSDIRLPQQAGRFHKTDERMGEFSDVVAFYAASEPGAVLVEFVGIMRGVRLETCGTSIARRANDSDRKVWHKERLEPWRDLAPLFAGMEAGKAATYGAVVDLDDVDLPMRAEVYILCGTGGSWIVQYEARYPRDVQGSGWIDELIAATAPES